jgi:hypothetical protein
MVTNSPDQSYLQMAFNRCQLRKHFDSLADALNNPAISLCLHRVASNLAKPARQPHHMRGALND